MARSASILPMALYTSGLDYPLIQSNNRSPVHNLAMLMVVDDAYTTDFSKTKMYFPGTGGTDFTTGLVESDWLTDNPNGAYMTTVWSQVNYDVVGVKVRTVPPWRYGYANINSPNAVGQFCKTAWHVRTMLKYIKANIPETEVVLQGSSAGASAILAYLAGYAGAHDKEDTGLDMVKGAVINAPTMGGLGNGTWNHPSRTLNLMAQMLGKVLPKPLICTYSDNDPYGPPDYSRRLQSVVPTEADTYIMSSGSLGHSWMNTVAGAPLARAWVNQIANGTTILDRFGNPAIKGPVAL